MMPTPRLIIIDDEPILAEVLVHIARDAYPSEADLAVECALTAEAALTAIRCVDPPDDGALIVLSDLRLPPSDITGIEILAEVKVRLPHAARVLMTGEDPEDIAEALEDARLDAFLAKPFTFDRMRALIVALVEERSLRSSAPYAVEIAARVLPTPVAVWPSIARARFDEGANAERAGGNPQARPE